MIEVEVFGASGRPARPRSGPSVRPERDRPTGRSAPPAEEVRRLCVLAAASAGVSRGHLAIEFVDGERIAQLNAEHRGEARPTDVLAFPIDGGEIAGVEAGAERAPGRAPPAGQGAEIPPQSELGDVVICPEFAHDLREAIVHGVLHLVGMDHETDDGEMLALQHELLARSGR
jgi:probable rRNA maturation factor